MKKIAGKTLVAFGVMGLVALGAGAASAVTTYTGSLTSSAGITGTNESGRQPHFQLDREQRP